MKRILALAAITIVAGCASYPVTAPWTTEQKVLGGTFVALDAIDYKQTSACLHQNTCHESNSVYGQHPSDGQLLATKAASAAFVFSIADYFPKYRNIALWAANGLQFGLVAHNVKTIGWKFGF